MFVASSLFSKHIFYAFFTHLYWSHSSLEYLLIIQGFIPNTEQLVRMRQDLHMKTPSESSVLRQPGHVTINRPQLHMIPPLSSVKPPLCLQCPLPPPYTPPAFLHFIHVPNLTASGPGRPTPPSPSPACLPGIPELPSVFLWQWEIQRLISLCQLRLSLCQLMKIWLASRCQECPES